MVYSNATWKIAGVLPTLAKLFSHAMAYLALLAMQATRWENLQVEIISRTFLSSAERVAIIAVRQFPPA